jgi:ABC-type Fe3+-hydroxamate transport system substrate-binding protein
VSYDFVRHLFVLYNQPMQVRDIRGKIFDAHRTPQRIVSLVPSVTEALFVFGAGNRVVGITDYCILPRDGVATKTRVGGTKNPRVDQIISLQPDLVIANVEENHKRAIDSLEAQGLSVFVMFPRTLRGALEEMRALASLVGADNSVQVLAPIERALAAIHAPTHRPRVFVPIWRDPWMTANGETFIGDLIETCGGINIFRDRERMFPLAADLGRTRSPLPSKNSSQENQKGERAPGATSRIVEGQDTRYPRVSLEEVAAHRPEVILLPDEPYRFAETDALELRAAFPNARVHLVDGTLVSWHGVRIAQAVETISGLLNGH